MSPPRHSRSLFWHVVLVQAAIYLLVAVPIIVRAMNSAFGEQESAIIRTMSTFADGLARMASVAVNPASVSSIAEHVRVLAVESMSGKQASSDLQPDEIAYQVWRRDQVLLARSTEVPPLAGLPPEVFEGNRPFQRSGWLLIARWSPDRSVFAVFGLSERYRNRVIRAVELGALGQLGIILATIGGSLWLGLRIALHPLVRLARIIAHRAPNDLTPLLPGKNYREFVPITQAFNTLLSRFRELLETERAFTANAAHELRTPIAAISAQAHVLIMEPEEADRRRAAEALCAGVERSARVIQKLLLLSKLDIRPERFEISFGDIAELLQEIVRDHRERADRKSQQLSLRTAAAPRYYVREALQAAVECLLDNALRYTPEGSRIEVELRLEGDETLISVADDGPGIPPELQARAFNRFDRLGRSDSEGSGLGLAIAQQVSHLHGGRIRLLTPADGKGTLLEMRLPLQLRRSRAGIYIRPRALFLCI